MPFADEAGLIAVGLEQLGQRRFGLTQAQVIGDHAVLVRILAGEKDRAGRTADRRIGERLAEEDAVGGEAIEVRRADVGIAHAAEGLGAELVRDDDEHIGTARRLGGARAGQQSEGEQRQREAVYRHWWSTGEVSGKETEHSVIISGN